MNVTLIICDIDCDEDNIDPYKTCELGSYEYINCYLSTISSLLEDDKWGSKFPVLIESLDAKAKLEPETCEELITELEVIKEELKNHSLSKIKCGDIDTENTNWMLEAPFDTLADNLYDYFMTLDETNLTNTFYEFAFEASEENMSVMYLFD
ncbi:MAG: Imm70 family immunity protein [Candidatus Gastranaerophilales bacterium]|nr:Imm70 family immunity protein [Candidatus Gastranaerophilales bacterium]